MRCSRQLYQNLLLHLELVMASVCKICAGPIEPLDQHLHCVACLGLAHAEAALDESDCGHCADLRPVRGGAHCRQRAAGEPPLSWRRERCLAVPPNPTVAAFADLFPRGLFPPPFQYWGIRSFWPRGGRRGHVHLGLGEGRLGWIGARAARQLRAFRPPGGAHEGSVESCSGVGAHLESSGGACQE